MAYDHLTSEQVAWIAGIFEGEGCFYFNSFSNKGRAQCRMRVSMTDEDVIRRLAELVTGSSVVSSQRPAHKLIWCWTLAQRPLIRELIVKLQPWLGLRRGQKARDFLHWLDENPVGPRKGLVGAKNPGAKLTESTVRAIRQRRPHSTLAALAKEYGVSLSTISNIALGDTWRHVDGV